MDELLNNLTREDVFKEISRSSFYGNLGLFIGAGLPMAIFNSPYNRIALSWEELITKCSNNLGIKTKDIMKKGLSYPEIATQLCKLYSESADISYEAAVKRLKEEISELTCLYPDSKSRKEFRGYFDSIDPRWIVTTNYDLTIECIMTGKGFSLSPEDQLISPKDLIPIYHLHGIRTNPKSIIITQEDYIGLFRPNQYRQQKLALTIKESLTILLGYNLGDFNVLSALDWSDNVFSDQKTIHPHNLIQFYHKEKPKNEPYKDRGILVIEFDDIRKLLGSLSETIESERKIYNKSLNDLKDVNNLLQSPDKDNVVRFVDDSEFRNELLNLLKSDDGYVIAEYYLSSGFLELFSKSMELTWERARQDGAFGAYAEILEILLDVLRHEKINEVSPAIFESVVYYLNQVASYIGSEVGQSFSGNRIWNRRRNEIPDGNKKEILGVAVRKNYHDVIQLLEKE